MHAQLEFEHKELVSTSPSPDTILRYLKAARSSMSVSAFPHTQLFVTSDLVSALEALATSPSPDTIISFRKVTLPQEGASAAVFIGKNGFGVAESSQRPHKTRFYIQQNSTRLIDLRAFMGMSILATTTAASDFASPSSFADVTGASVSFTLTAAKTVIVLFLAKSLTYSDAMASEAQVGINYDGNDVVLHEFIGHSAGTNVYKAPVYSMYTLSLAAGAHTIKARAKTVDGAEVGNLAADMQLVVLG